MLNTSHYVHKVLFGMCWWWITGGQQVDRERGMKGCFPPDWSEHFSALHQRMCTRQCILHQHCAKLWSLHHLLSPVHVQHQRFNHQMHTSIQQDSGSTRRSCNCITTWTPKRLGVWGFTFPMPLGNVEGWWNVQCTSYKYIPTQCARMTPPLYGLRYLDAKIFSICALSKL